MYIIPELRVDTRYIAPAEPLIRPRIMVYIIIKNYHSVKRERKRERLKPTDYKYIYSRRQKNVSVSCFAERYGLYSSTLRTTEWH